VEAWRRLAEAKQQQLDVERQLQASQEKCRNLENLVSHLQERCVVLEQQRDRAREVVRAELQEELEIARVYREEAETMLSHARRTREDAHDLRLDAERNVLREQAAVDEAEAVSAPDEMERVPAPVSTTDLAGLPPIEQVRAVLDAAGEQLAAQDQELNDLRDMVRGTAAEDPGIQTLPGATTFLPTDKPVVRGESADNTKTAAQGRSFPAAEVRRIHSPRWRRWSRPGVSTSAAVLSPVCGALVSAVATSGFAAGVWAEPGPAVWELVLYAVLLLIFTLVVVIVQVSWVDTPTEDVRATVWDYANFMVVNVPMLIGIWALWPPAPTSGFWSWYAKLGRYIADFTGLL
jgi:hypothetical protein